MITNIIIPSIFFLFNNGIGTQCTFRLNLLYILICSRHSNYLVDHKILTQIDFLSFLRVCSISFPNKTLYLIRKQNSEGKQVNDKLANTFGETGECVTAIRGNGSISLPLGFWMLVIEAF